MFKTRVIKVSSFHSKKTDKDYFVAWVSSSDGLPCKLFVPEWVKPDMDIIIKIVPDFNCNASFEISKV